MTPCARTPRSRRAAAKNAVPQVPPEMLSKAEIVHSAAPIEGCCGIYFLQRSAGDSSRIVYVGQSLNVYARVGQHQAEARRFFDSWSWVECHESQLDLMESLYIHWLLPEEQGRVHKNYLPTDERSAPIVRRHLQHLLDALQPRG